MSSNQSSIFKSFRSSTTLSVLVMGRRSKKGFWDRTLNFRTTVGQYFLLVLLLSAGFVPALILLVQNIRRVYDSVERWNQNLEANKNVEQALAIRRLIYTLQLERGHSALYVGSGGDVRTQTELFRRRMEVDKVFYALSIRYEGCSSWSSIFSNKSDFILSLLTFRHGIDTQQVNDYDVVAFYSNINANLLQWMKTFLHSVTLGTFWPDLTALEALVISTENSGQERARGAIFFSRGFVSFENLRPYMANVVIGRKSLKEASEFSDSVLHYVQQSQYRNMTVILNKFREMVFSNGSGSIDVHMDHVETAKQWVAYMTKYINNLHDLQSYLGVRIMKKTIERSAAQRTICTHSSILTVLEFFIYPVFVILTVRLTSRIKQYSVILSERLKVLAREQRRNAALVKEMYPTTVAHRLLKGQDIEPESFESATICFSGLADFADVSRQSHGVDIIFFINRLFDLMDNEIIKHDVFKVETVGDQYVVVSGVPVRNGERHVAEVADMALGLLNHTRNLKVDHLPNYDIRLKFGVCSGSVVAGIVGLKMPRYCMFGDTVNVASRMQSSSEALRIHLSTSSGELLTRNGRYDVQPRGNIQIKGKGIVQTFWLCGRHS